MHCVCDQLWMKQWQRHRQSAECLIAGVRVRACIRGHLLDGAVTVHQYHNCPPHLPTSLVGYAKNIRHARYTMLRKVPALKAP